MASDIKQEHIIRQISAPSIVVDDLAVVDMESGVDNASAKNTTDYPIKASKKQGSEQPLIQINNQLYKDDAVVSMMIETSGFLPTITVSLLMKTKVLYSSGFPMDGDIMTVFVRSHDDTLKPIKNDYEITSVTVRGSNGAETISDIMTITGVLYVEKITSMQCASYKGTSIEVLQKIAENLQLGFATNEVSTNDSQKWLSPYRKTQDYIQEITEAAWKDEKSFFTSFVDIFYHLNFVNVDPLFSIAPGKELGISRESYSTDYTIDTELIKTNLQILFTNNSMAMHSSQYINKYEQKNMANAVNRAHGYVKYDHHYDSTLRKKVKLYSDPLTSPGAAESNVILKGRYSSDQRFNRVTHNWNGTIYGENGENQHSKYLYAKTWNHQNMVHLDKMYLDVELPQINMNLRKYQVIPLLITVQEDAERRILNQPTDSTNSSTPATPGATAADSVAVSDNQLAFVVEKFYTGDYVIQDIKYEYKRGGFVQKLKLLRREWPTPAQLPRNTT